MGNLSLQKCKGVKGAEMSTAVKEARAMADWLVQQESRGNGDLENTMRRLETRWGVPWRTFWSLRYRPPKDILMGTYEGIKAAYLAECERQKRRLEHEIEITKAMGVTGPALDAAEALVRESKGGAHR